MLLQMQNIKNIYNGRETKTSTSMKNVSKYTPKRHKNKYFQK